MRQSIRGYADGVIDQAGDGLGGIAAELSAVRDVVAGSDDLGRVLNDVAVTAASRRAVVADLFGSQIGAGTLRLLDYVVDHDRAADTTANIQWLAARFEAATRNLYPVGDVVLGQKSAEERLEGYAAAFFEKVDGEREFGEIEDELFRFARVVAGSDELQAALLGREVPADLRRRLVIDLIGSKATATTTKLAAYATQVGRPRDYEELLEFLVERVAAESNRRLAEVRSAVELDDEQCRNLTAALGRAIGHDVEVRVTVDPSLLAGFVATIGDTVVDGSARHRLEILKERLVTPEVRINTGEQ